jgi:hypothetical protein
MFSGDRDSQELFCSESSKYWFGRTGFLNRLECLCLRKQDTNKDRTMPSEIRYCRKCRSMTLHVAVRGKDVMAHLCEPCLLPWASPLDSKETTARAKLRFKQEGEPQMETRYPDPKEKPKMVLLKICCDACNSLQVYHGKSHTRCIHCHKPLDLSKVKTKYQ